MFLRAVSLLSVLVIVVSQTMSPNVQESPLGLALYVKDSLRALSIYNGFHEGKAALAAIVFTADVLLAGFGSQPVELIDGIKPTIKTRDAVVALAVELYGDFTLLSQIADTLKKGLESKDDISITDNSNTVRPKAATFTTDNIIAIRLKAAKIIQIVESLDRQYINNEKALTDYYVIGYQNTLDLATDDRQRRRYLCLTLYRESLCYEPYQENFKSQCKEPS